MSLASRPTSLQNYHMLVYRSALHPEFVSIDGRQRIAHGDYEVEAWVFRGGHVLRFAHSNVCISEVVTESTEDLPDRGLVTTLPCAGEKDHEAEFGDQVIYMTSMQTETLTDHLYLGTYEEMLEHGRACGGLVSLWTDEYGKRNMSLIDMQRYNDQVHVQCYHMRSDCLLVLRTQSIFQVKNGE
jgi:hypothetical protein